MTTVKSDELKRIQLDILIHIDRFCRERGINYSLYGGTMIGAVRHKGFIPWDDDIDIMLLRDDYDRFIKEYSKVDQSKYKLNSTINDSKFPYPYAKVSDEDTILKEHIVNPYPMGINVDVFPIDYLPNDRLVIKRAFKKFRVLDYLLSVKLMKYNKKRSILKSVILLLLKFILLPFSYSFFISKIQKNATKYCHIRNQKCGDLVSGYGIRELQDITNFSSYIDVDFEGHKFMACVGYEDYLVGVFGDYMLLPPENKRICHHSFDAWYK